MMTDVTWRELTRNVYRLGHDCTATDTLHHGRLTTGITDQKTSRRPTARLVHLSAYMPGLPWFLQHLLQPEAVRRPHVGKTVCEKLTKDLSCSPEMGLEKQRLAACAVSSWAPSHGDKHGCRSSGQQPNRALGVLVTSKDQPQQTPRTRRRAAIKRLRGESCWPFPAITCARELEN